MKKLAILFIVLIGSLVYSQNVVDEDKKTSEVFSKIDSIDLSKINIVNKTSQDKELYKKLKTAVNYYNRNDFFKSINVCNELIAYDYYLNFIYYLKGLNNIKLTKFEDAKKNFKNVLRVNESKLTFYNNETLFDLAFLKISKINDNKKVAMDYFLKGEEHVEKGDYYKAGLMYSKAIKYNPDSDLFYYKMALINLDISIIDYAIENLKKALMINPRKIEYYKLLINSYKQKDDVNEIITLAKQGLKYYPKNFVFKQVLNQYSKRKFVTNIKVAKIIKRIGDTIYVNAGILNGISQGIEFKKKFFVYKKNLDIEDIETNEVLGKLENKIVGQILVTKVENNFFQAIIIKEVNQKLEIGDQILY